LWLDCAWSFLSQTLLGCDERHEVNNTARYANVERAMNDVMREKEIVDNKLEDSIFVYLLKKRESASWRMYYYNGLSYVSL